MSESTPAYRASWAPTDEFVTASQVTPKTPTEPCPAAGACTSVIGETATDGSAPGLATTGAPCNLNACHVCTGCAHSHHDACRLTVRCPGTGETHVCRCCGTEAS